MSGTQASAFSNTVQVHSYNWIQNQVRASRSTFFSFLSFCTMGVHSLCVFEAMLSPHNARSWLIVHSEKMVKFEKASFERERGWSYHYHDRALEILKNKQRLAGKISFPFLVPVLWFLNSFIQRSSPSENESFDMMLKSPIILSKKFVRDLLVSDISAFSSFALSS
jgi:hypothetical protein